MQPSDNPVTLAIFEGRNIRQIWYNDEWWFSVVDIVEALLESQTHRQASNYWNKLSQRLREEGADEVLIECLPLKLVALNGKNHETTCANTETLFKIIQFIPAVQHRERKKGYHVLRNSGVYAIINSITQEQYIGSSRDMKTRFMQHRSALRRNRHHAAKLQDAWNLNGEEAFTFVLLESVPNESDLEQIEQRYVDDEKPTYNKDISVTNAGFLAIEETRIQKFIMFLRDQAGLSLQNACFQDLHLLIDRRIITPGPNYYRLSEAEMAGVATWEIFREFLLNQQ